mmetsp:Transcript_24437/g.68094  ORF Transcript_24437/g.68094 Transcript_24437/m.68094 type:complete len:101 (+) Transcript_24437:1912-2214(+)
MKWKKAGLNSPEMCSNRKDGSHCLFSHSTESIRIPPSGTPKSAQLVSSQLYQNGTQIISAHLSRWKEGYDIARTPASQPANVPTTRTESDSETPGRPRGW